MSDERFIDAPPAGAEGWREVWQEDRRYRTGGGLAGRLREFVRRLLASDVERQRNFNLVLLDLVRDAHAEVEALRRDVRGDLDAVLRDMRIADAALAEDLARVRELIPIAAKRNDALVAALDQKIETLAVRVRDAVNPVATGTQPAPRRDDVLYRRLEDGLRGSEAEVREAVAPYVDLAQSAQPVLDVGCGRGEFLLACREAGIDARGFDTNERSVSDLEQRGIHASLNGVPECFASFEAGSVGSILAMHVVEHLPVEILFALFAEAARVLRSGGLLMIETPNAESLVMSASEFWRDPTHLAPRHPAALTLLGREHGFDVQEIRAVHELPAGTRLAHSPDDTPELRRVIDAINERVFGPQDLRLILRKR